MKEDEDDEKDEIDASFLLLKTLFRAEDTDHDDCVTQAQFLTILQNIHSSTPSPKMDSTMVSSIFTKVAGKSQVLAFKQFLYAVYLYVTD